MRLCIRNRRVFPRQQQPAAKGGADQGQQLSRDPRDQNRQAGRGQRHPAPLRVGAEIPGHGKQRLSDHRDSGNLQPSQPTARRRGRQ